MGYATAYEVWVNPAVRDWQTIVPMTLFWFAVQLIAQYLVLPRVPGWKRFTAVDKEDLIIRAVSIVNGFIMMMSAFVFLMNLYEFYDMTLPTDLYAEVYVHIFPFFRAAITSYFLWDLIVCFWFKWTVAWKVHAVASLLGCYTLLFPFSDVYAGFYTGCFEVSNAFMHFSVTYRMIARYNQSNKALAAAFDGRAAICEYLFAFLFTCIRVLAGSFVTFTWARVSLGNLVHDLTQRGADGFEPRCHDELAYVIAIVAIGTIQLLQYVWFVEIVKKALGLCAGGAAGEGKDKGGAKKTEDAPAARQSSQKRKARKED